MENKELAQDAARMDEILAALKEILPMPNEQVKNAFLASLIGLLSG